MIFNSVLALAISIIPAFAQNSKFGHNDSEIYFEEFSEDNFSMKDILGVANIFLGDTQEFWKKYEKKENEIKPDPNSVTVQMPDVNDVKRHWGHTSFSYCIKDQKPYHMCSYGECKGFNVTRTFENKELKTFVIVGHDIAKKEVIVAHRGSQNINNWLSNFDFKLTSLESGKSDIKVHSGFYEVYNSNEKQVNSYLQSLLKDPIYKGFKVVFTGHSLGAAVTTIHAAKLAASIKAMGNKVELYPYHSPRVGDKKFAEYVSGLGISIARYTNKKDPVSRVPGRSMLFSHIVGEFHNPSSDKSNSLIKCDQKYFEDPKCGISEALFNIEDHQYAFGIKKSEYCGKN